jgi:hypothetical protein
LLAAPACDEKPRAPLRPPSRIPLPDIAFAEPDLEASLKYPAAVQSFGIISGTRSTKTGREVDSQKALQGIVIVQSGLANGA